MRSHPVSAGRVPHCAYADTERAELYCAACGTYVYSREFDHAVLGVRGMASGVTPDATVTAGGGGGAGGAPPSKRRRHTPSPMSFAHAEVAAAGGDLLESVNTHGVPRGLRGIANLGNTCFLSTVLQAMVRAPTVGAFFLRDGHNRELCAAQRGRRVAAAGNLNPEP
jgi:ubiquitin carboxyl-terminal hydrolase 22/27/51